MNHARESEPVSPQIPPPDGNRPMGDASGRQSASVGGNNYGIMSTADHAVNVNIAFTDNGVRQVSLSQLPLRQPPPLSRPVAEGPLFGRDAIIEAVTSRLAAGMSAQIFGEPGVGKKAIAREVHGNLAMLGRHGWMLNPPAGGGEGLDGLYRRLATLVFGESILTGVDESELAAAVVGWSAHFTIVGTALDSREASRLLNTFPDCTFLFTGRTQILQDADGVHHVPPLRREPAIQLFTASLGATFGPPGPDAALLDYAIQSSGGSPLRLRSLAAYTRFYEQWRGSPDRESSEDPPPRPTEVGSRQQAGLMATMLSPPARAVLAVMHCFDTALNPAWFAPVTGDPRAAGAARELDDERRLVVYDGEAYRATADARAAVVDLGWPVPKPAVVAEGITAVLAGPHPPPPPDPALLLSVARALHQGQEWHRAMRFAAAVVSVAFAAGDISAARQLFMLAADAAGHAGLTEAQIAFEQAAGLTGALLSRDAETLIAAANALEAWLAEPPAVTDPATGPPVARTPAETTTSTQAPAAVRSLPSRILSVIPRPIQAVGNAAQRLPGVQAVVRAAHDFAVFLNTPGALALVGRLAAGLVVVIAAAALGLADSGSSPTHAQVGAAQHPPTLATASPTTPGTGTPTAPSDVGGTSESLGTPTQTSPDTTSTSASAPISTSPGASGSQSPPGPSGPPTSPSPSGPPTSPGPSGRPVPSDPSGPPAPPPGAGAVAPAWGFAQDVWTGDAVGSKHNLYPNADHNTNEESNWTSGSWNLGIPSPSLIATATHVAIGHHRVVLPHIGAAGGIALAVAYDSKPAGLQCHPGSWQQQGLDEAIDVYCFDPAGNAIDTPFDVLFLAGTQDDAHAIGVARGFVYASEPTAASYTPGAPFEHNAGTVTRLSTGRYTVALPGGARTAQLSPVSTLPRSCTLTALSGTRATVACAAPGGSPADTAFALSYTGAQSLLDDSRRPHGAFLAVTNTSDPTGPTLADQWTSKPGTTTVKRTATGRYSLQIPVGRLLSYTHVNARGTGYCSLVLRNDGTTDQAVFWVACYNYSGALTDTSFDLVYMTDSPYE